jgi:hypothetical protein
MQRPQKERSVAKRSERPHLVEPLSPLQIEITDSFVRLSPLLAEKTLTAGSSLNQ